MKYVPVLLFAVVIIYSAATNRMEWVVADGLLSIIWVLMQIEEKIK